MTGPHAFPRLRVYRLKPPAVGKKARAKAAAATAAATAKDLYCCATLSKGATRGEQCGGGACSVGWRWDQAGVR